MLPLAHAALVETTPAEGARLATGPDAVTFVFSQPVGEKYGVVEVTGPEGGQWQDGGPQVSDAGTTVTQPLLALGPAGGYTVAWRVVSTDGHPVSGRFDFTLTTAGEGTPLPPAADEPAGEGSWLLAGGLVLGVLILVVLVVAGSRLVRRRRSVGVDLAGTSPGGQEEA